MKLTNNIGFIFLSIYLILIGLTPLVPMLLMNIPGLVFPVLALVAGIFILIGK